MNNSDLFNTLSIVENAFYTYFEKEPIFSESIIKENIVIILASFYSKNFQDIIHLSLDWWVTYCDITSNWHLFFSNTLAVKVMIVSIPNFGFSWHNNLNSQILISSMHLIYISCTDVLWNIIYASCFYQIIICISFHASHFCLSECVRCPET